MTPKALAGLVAFISSRRPNWTEIGIRNALQQMLSEHPEDDAVDAALRGSRDQVIATPGALPLPGPHWATPPRATTPTAGPPALGPLPECANCGTPRRRDYQPRHCPTCGHHWRDQTDTHLISRAHTGHAERTSCAVCGHAGRAGFPKCTNCGNPMPEPPPSRRPRIAERANLDDPKPLREIVGEMFPEKDEGEQEGFQW